MTKTNGGNGGPTKAQKLTKAIFAEGIGLIAARWNRDMDPSVSAVMAEWLSEQQCTGDEFIAGVKRAVAEDEWPPSAKRILDLARPVASAEARAGAVFAKIRSLGKYIVPHGTRWSLDDIGRECGDVAVRALVSIGGPRRLIDASDESINFMLRDFVKAFVEFQREQDARAVTGRLLERGAQQRQLAAGTAANGPVHPKGESHGG